MKKCKKIISFVIVVVLCFVIFSFSVSAEAVKTFNFDITKVRAQFTYSLSGSDFSLQYSDWYNFSPKNVLSPYGGSAYAVQFSDKLKLNYIDTYQANWYVDPVTIKKDVKYTIHFRFFVPVSKLEHGLSLNGNMFDSLVFQMVDSNRVSHLFYNQHQGYLADSSNWTKSKMFIDNAGYNYGFFEVELDFVPTSDWTLWFFGMQYSFVGFEDSTGYIGLSDIYLEYPSDGSVVSAIDDTNSRLDSIGDSIDDTNSKVGAIENSLTSEAYSGVDDSKVNEEGELTAEIEDSTAHGRGQAVAIIDSASDIQGSYIENGLLMWTNVLESVINRLPWFGKMLRFSLALGLFSFLMGIITYAVGKTSAKNRQQNSRPKTKNKGG